MRYYGSNQLSKVDHTKDEHLVNPFPPGFEKVSIVESTSGKWKVEKFTVPNDITTDLYNLRLIRDGRRDRIVPPGEYTRLCYDDALVMSDTPAEAREHSRFYKAAKGSVLISGLGLGFTLQAILRKPAVKDVTVLEKSKDVIKLVGASVTDARVKIVHADAFTWKWPTKARWDVAWHDIWNDISEENEEPMEELKQRFRAKCKWQGCWSQEYL